MYTPPVEVELLAAVAHWLERSGAAVALGAIRQRLLLQDHLLGAPEMFGSQSALGIGVC